MRFGLLTQWYDPEPGPAGLPGGLARGLVERGHRVQVVTGFPNYPTGVLADGYRQSPCLDEVIDGVAIRRVPLYPSHDASSAKRVLNYGSFALSASVAGLSALDGIDALWVNYSPVTVGLPMLLQRAMRRTPTVTHVLDLWPDTLFASGFGGGGRAGAITERALSRWCNALYRNSERVAYISPGVGDVLLDRGVPGKKLVYAPMWADEGVFDALDVPIERGWGLGDGDIALVYAGTLGGAQGLDSLIHACADLKAEPQFRCLIAGSGVREAELRRLAERVGANNVTFLGRLERTDMRSLMAAGDVHYIGLNDHRLAATTMPSKVQTTFACARPVIASVVGDAAHVVEDADAGWVVPPSEAKVLAEAVRSAIKAGRPGLASRGRKARSYYEREFSARVGIDRIERLLVDVADGGAA